ncbi:hypothetical protein HU200_051616 [Digitaria exilis]|uniref:F-box domain-containing protein n=1 Tax=Digitaria exilis TaxID=1010633 RepID=A0A835AKY5_9POAL|nr:hypothetical protein HU200_051616 [Digitaria exilis]
MEQDTAAAACLPDDLVVEILWRLPAKSLCRFKCVSRCWRRLIPDPAHRFRLAQTLSGFFFCSRDPPWRFTALPSFVTPLGLAGDGGLPLVDTALSFLPPSCGEIKIMGSCNGLLLLLCSNDDELSRSGPPPFYVVCNPATREWVALPQPRYTLGQFSTIITWYATVGFDPAISSHFYVFQVVEEDYMITNYLKAVEIYSSETGTWDKRESEYLHFLGQIAYFNGFLHLPMEYNDIVSVGTKGQPWRGTCAAAAAASQFRVSPCWTQDTTAAAYLPDELIVEILAWLPAKSLCCFKCVSQRWCRLISDPAHRVRLAQTLSGFFFVSRDPAWRFTALPSSVTPLGLAGDDGLPLVDTALSFLPPSYGEINILGSCNGLLLLLCSNNDLLPSVPPPFYVVCNPATREWVVLPQPRHIPGEEYGNECNATAVTWYATIGFDPAISSASHGGSPKCSMKIVTKIKAVVTKAILKGACFTVVVRVKRGRGVLIYAYVKLRGGNDNGRPCSCWIVIVVLLHHVGRSALAAAYLPDELVVEILARLPAKSLCRFKCVSRRWCRLISDPAHRARLAQTLSGFFFVSRDPAWRFTTLPSSVTPLDLTGDDGLPLLRTDQGIYWAHAMASSSCSALTTSSYPLPHHRFTSSATPPPGNGHTPGYKEYCDEYNVAVFTSYATGHGLGRCFLQIAAWHSGTTAHEIPSVQISLHAALRMDTAAIQDPMAYLPQDLVVEILSRLPAKSLCRVKCVSRSWRALISDPAHRCRLAQTLSGFFFRRCRPDKTTPPPLGFAGLDASPPPLDDPSLSFLPSSWSKIWKLLDSCNGLLLLRCSSQPSAGSATGSSPPPPFYVVCNPATGDWVALPQPSVEPGRYGTTRTCSASLGFDPAVSSHFHVFQLVEKEGNHRISYHHGMEEVEIYSSQTGAWTSSKNDWAGSGWPRFAGHTVYFNGFQHFTTRDGVLVLVDVKGQQPWRKITVPPFGALLPAMEQQATTTAAAPYLPDELIAEILSRLPARSRCRSKCVSRRWRRLITDPSPCFYFWTHYDGVQHRWDFVATNGDGGQPHQVDSSLSFLPPHPRAGTGRRWRCSTPATGSSSCAAASPATGVAPPQPAFYVVCNPATKEWVALPQPSLEPGFDDFYTKTCRAALGFDPSVSSHFHVFQLEESERCYDHYVSAVEIYSSETGAWARKEKRWYRLTGHMAFFNGFLHLTTWENVLATVDVRGQTWRTIRPFSRPLGVHGCPDQTNGEWWTLKHKVSQVVLFGLGELPPDLEWNPTAGFHPTCHKQLASPRLAQQNKESSIGREAHRATLHWTTAALDLVLTEVDLVPVEVDSPPEIKDADISDGEPLHQGRRNMISSTFSVSGRRGQRRRVAQPARRRPEAPPPDQNKSTSAAARRTSSRFPFPVGTRATPLQLLGLLGATAAAWRALAPHQLLSARPDGDALGVGNPGPAPGTGLMGRGSRRSPPAAAAREVIVIAAMAKSSTTHRFPRMLWRAVRVRFPWSSSPLICHGHARTRCSGGVRAGTEAAGEAFQLPRVHDDDSIVSLTSTRRARSDRSRLPDFPDHFAGPGLASATGWAWPRARGVAIVPGAGDAVRRRGPGGQGLEGWGAVSRHASARRAGRHCPVVSEGISPARWIRSWGKGRVDWNPKAPDSWVQAELVVYGQHSTAAGVVWVSLTSRFDRSEFFHHITLRSVRHVVLSTVHTSLIPTRSKTSSAWTATDRMRDLRHVTGTRRHWYGAAGWPAGAGPGVDLSSRPSPHLSHRQKRQRVSWTRQLMRVTTDAQMDRQSRHSAPRAVTRQRHRPRDQMTGA